MLGYVRHFHPSDEAVEADWDAFALEGVRQIEPAKNKKELAALLNKLFSPIAPTVHVFPTGKRAELPKELTPAKTDGLKIISWHHEGYGQKRVTDSIYRTERKTRAIIAENAPEKNAPDPRRPFVADLGGVSASVPLGLFADDTGTLPRESKRRGSE